MLLDLIFNELVKQQMHITGLFSDFDNCISKELISFEIFFMHTYFPLRRKPLGFVDAKDTCGAHTQVRALALELGVQQHFL